MKYFTLHYPTSPQEIGTYPQIKNIKDVESCEIIEQHKTKFIGDSIPPINKVQNLELSIPFTPTSFLSSHRLTGNGVICDTDNSNTLKTICSNCQEIHLEFTDSKFNEKYTFLYKKHDSRIINYEQSTFCIINTLTGLVIKDDIKVSDLDSWSKLIIQQDDVFVSVLPKHIVLNQKRDWIKLPFSNINIVSEELKDKLKDSTGILFKEHLNIF